MNPYLNSSQHCRIFILLLLASCALYSPRAAARGASKAKPRSKQNLYAVLEKVPAKARLKLNPLDGNADAVLAGSKLFQEHCAECHGTKAAGAKRGPSLIDDTVEQATPGSLFWILSNGVVRHGMPDWSKLPEPQRWQIVSFLKSFKAQISSGSSQSP